MDGVRARGCASPREEAEGLRAKARTNGHEVWRVAEVSAWEFVGELWAEGGVQGDGGGDAGVGCSRSGSGGAGMRRGRLRDRPPPKALEVQG